MKETHQIEGSMNDARIRQLRVARGWSQERLAEESGVAVRTIQRLDAGNDASLETLSLVAKALDVPVRDLFASVADETFRMAVSGLDARIEAHQRGRARARRADRGWRYLYVALGIAVTIGTIIAVSSPSSSGALILIVPAYWIGGLFLLLFLERSVLGPRREARYPLADGDQPRAPQ